MAIDPEFLSRLRRIEGCVEASGAEGEKLTRRLLDAADVGWFEVKQPKDEKSKTLAAYGAKRTDFVAAWNGTALLLDTKCYQPLCRHDDGSVTFGLTDSELAQLEATGKMFGLPVAVIIWDRKHPKEIYVVDMIEKFATTEVDVLGEPGRSLRFAAQEICRL